MKSNNMNRYSNLYRVFLLILFLVVAGCGGSGGSPNNSASNSSSKTLVSISITPANPVISIGGVQQFSVMGEYSDKTTQDLTGTVTWSSSNLAVLTISNDAGSIGKATAVSVGTTTITATSGGVSGATPVTVTAETLVSLAVSPVNPMSAPGTTQQFSVFGTFSDNTTHDMTTAVTWNSSNTSVATISNAVGSNGKASTITAGQTTITATSGSVTGSTILTVTSASLMSLAVTPSNPSIALGATQQFVATGSFSDGSHQTLTTSVVWSSSNTSVASVSNLAGSAGLASPVASGSTTIMASVSGVTGSTVLTVSSGGAQANVMQITVNGALCSAGSYTNKPCVSVTVCSPDGTGCQTVSNILLDTGSTGLRIFKQALSAPLTQVASGSGSLAECITYGDGSENWGPIKTASVVLGSEPAVQMSIQVIDSSFGSRRSSVCRSADASPSVAGFNGVLGVAPLTQDCGSVCANSSNNSMYYSCSGSSSCSPAAVPLANQVQNPVVLLPQDNNGVLVQLPSVPLGGVAFVNGSLILGIGTQSNNMPSSAVEYSTNLNAEFTTSFNGNSNSASFIDSGSNGYFFNDTTGLLPSCSGSNSGFYCPASTTSLSAINTGSTGSPSGTVSFKVGNFSNLINSGNSVFVEAGGTGSGGFDWGLPFFFGRSVFFGIENKISILGTGPFFAY